MIDAFFGVIDSVINAFTGLSSAGVTGVSDILDAVQGSAESVLGSS